MKFKKNNCQYMKKINKKILMIIRFNNAIKTNKL